MFVKMSSTENLYKYVIKANSDSSLSMDELRVTSPGPMAEKSKLSAISRKVSNSRRSFEVTDSFPNKAESLKEFVSVQTSAPAVERRILRDEQLQQYYGDINLLSVIDTTKEIMCCKYTEEGYEVAAGFVDGVVRLFDNKTGACTHTLVDNELLTYPGPVTALKHRPVSSAHPITNTLLASYVNGCIKCWKYKYDQCLYTIREKRQTLGLNYHPRDSKFVTYGDDEKLNMYDEEAQTQERAFYCSGMKGAVDGHTSRIFACAFNPKAYHELISGGWDDKVFCWDDRQPYATRYLNGAIHMCGEGLDFDKPGRQILTCSWQDKDSIQIWDYGSGKLIDNVVPDHHMCRLYCGKFVPQTNLMVCGGSDTNILRVVDTKMKVTECAIKNNPGAIYAFDFGHKRRKRSSNGKLSELPAVPRVTFVTGKRLQTVDFG